jgi:hypothetical protein
MDDRPEIPDRERGLYPKYRAFKLPGEDVGLSQQLGAELTEPFFLLKFDDPHARRALLVYALSCQIQYPQLAYDIRTKLHETKPLVKQDYADARQSYKSSILEEMTIPPSGAQS